MTFGGGIAIKFSMNGCTGFARPLMVRFCIATGETTERKPESKGETESGEGINKLVTKHCLDTKNTYIYI